MEKIGPDISIKEVFGMDTYKERLEQLKQESARELGVNLNQTKDITAREAGSVGGRMVQKIFDSYKK